MKQWFKRKLVVMALAGMMGLGTLASGSIISYATNDQTVVAVDITKVEALKTYKGNTTEFNAYDYYIINIDLQTAIGPDGDALLKHYTEFGKKEGRVAIAATTATSDSSPAVPQPPASAQSASTTVVTQSVVNTGGSGNGFDTYNIPEQQKTEDTYVLNTSTMKFHKPSCNDVKKIKPENYSTTSLSRDDVIAQGYSSCGHCKP